MLVLIILLFDASQELHPQANHLRCLLTGPTLNLKWATATVHGVLARKDAYRPRYLGNHFNIKGKHLGFMKVPMCTSQLPQEPG